MRKPEWNWHNDGPLVILGVGVVALVVVIVLVPF
jgi:hypothetical protein